MYKIQHKNFFSVNSTRVDLNFTLHKGAINLLIGRNGIGKSTFFDQLKEKNIISESIAFMDQFPLCPISDYKVTDLVNIISGECKNSISLNEISQKYQIEITDLLNKYVSYLSGGEQQRVKLIMTLMLNREAVFLDEPFQYLDQNSVEIFKQVLKQLESEEKLLFIIEHNRDYLKDLKTHEIMMQEKNELIEVFDGN